VKKVIEGYVCNIENHLATEEGIIIKIEKDFEITTANNNQWTELGIELEEFNNTKVRIIIETI
jgi:hypothetical protein